MKFVIFHFRIENIPLLLHSKTISYCAFWLCIFLFPSRLLQISSLIFPARLAYFPALLHFKQSKPGRQESQNTTPTYSKLVNTYSFPLFNGTPIPPGIPMNWHSPTVSLVATLYFSAPVEKSHVLPALLPTCSAVLVPINWSSISSMMRDWYSSSASRWQGSEP